MIKSTRPNYNFFETHSCVTIKVNSHYKILKIQYNDTQELFSNGIDLESIFSNFISANQIGELYDSIKQVFASHLPTVSMVTVFNISTHTQSYWSVTNSPSMQHTPVPYVFIKFENISHFISQQEENICIKSGGNIKKFIPRSNIKKFKQTIKLHEEHFRLLVSNIKDYAIFMLDEKGFIMSWNRGAQAIKQYKAKEIIGKHFSIFYTEEARKKNHPEHELKLAVQNGRYEEEGWRVKKDKSLFWANVVITPIYDSKGKHIGFGKVTRDLTEKKKLEQIKEKMIAIISHELRTPVTSIMGSLKIIEQALTENITEKYSTLLHIAINNCERLERLINNVLDIEKIKGSHLLYNFKLYDLSLLIKEAITLNEGYAEKYKVHLRPLELQKVYVNVDSDRLIQVLTNLISNAVKFSPKNSLVEISMEREDHSVTIAIKDKGPGIPDDFREKIFQWFSQGDHTYAKSYEGAGLGLAISKSIMEQLHGNLTYQSEVNKGTTFYMNLPTAEL